MVDVLTAAEFGGGDGLGGGGFGGLGGGGGFDDVVVFAPHVLFVHVVLKALWPAFGLK
jgi:hypothetical protein